MGEQMIGSGDMGERGNGWTVPPELIDDINELENTPAGEYMAGEPVPSENIPDEPQMLKADHVAPIVDKIQVSISSPRGNALDRLANSRKVDFSVEPHIINGQPAPDGQIHPKLHGSEDEQEREAKKIRAFMRKHEDLILALSFKPGYLHKAADLEEAGELPEKYSKRFQANSLLAKIEDAKQHHLKIKASEAEAEYGELQESGVKPLTQEDINNLLDGIIETDSQAGLFN